jgi:tRNA threonylcarbamoyladenosine biosynthesis protein TsaB
MIVLLDTSTAVCRLTLVDGDARHDYEWQADRQLAKGLLGWLHERLAAQGTDWSGITGLGAFMGPGSFTGLRIGLTVMNTLADSLGVPIIGGRGDGWQNDVLSRLDDGQNDQIVLPFYGSEANITAPRK